MTDENHFNDDTHREGDQIRDGQGGKRECPFKNHAARTDRETDFAKEKEAAEWTVSGGSSDPQGVGGADAHTGDSPGVWRPRSSREGIGPVTYVWWNSFYAVLEFFNRAFAFNPYRKVSWDKSPISLAAMYLIAKIRFNRSNALTEPYDYAANDTKQFGPEPERVRHYYEGRRDLDFRSREPSDGRNEHSIRLEHSAEEGASGRREYHAQRS